MTSSIVFTDTIDIKFNKKNKFKYKDETVNEVYEFQQQEIPAVRYRFDKYELKQLVYIKNSLRKFKYSVHIAELKIDENTSAEDVVETINKLAELKEVAIFLYFDITKDNVATKTFNESQRTILTAIKTNCLDKIERVMMKDKEGVLHMMVARPLVLSLANFLGLSKDKIGYCSCAFSTNGLCCLTAERARDIAARYSSNEHFAIATNAVEGKNIEHQNGCYCIRHIFITHDIELDESDKNKEVEVKSEIKELEVKKEPGVKDNIKKTESKKSVDKANTQVKIVTKKKLKVKKGTVL